jgi:hypothetical protein
MQRTIDEGGNPMQRRVHLLIVGVVATGLALASQAGASRKQPPTTASLMPAYVQAAKYWQSRPLPSLRRQPSA